MTPAIKCTWAELYKNTGLDGTTTIPVSELGRFGLSDEIINLMLECDIFPQAFVINTVPVVARESIFGVVRQLLTNEMRIYKDHVTVDKLAEDVRKYMEETKVQLSPEQLASIRAGELTVSDAIASVIEARKTETTKEIVDG